MTPRVRKAIESSGGRKFLLAVGAGTATTVLQWFGKLDPAGSTYALAIGSTVGAYIVGNVMQKNAAPPPVDGPK